MERMRFRELGFSIGEFPTGPLNAITDIPGITVGHTTVIHDEPSVARTGVTIIFPRGGEESENNVFAGYHSLNGAGEMTGLAWLDHFGTISTPIGLTNTLQVGVVRDAILTWMREKGRLASWAAPVVAETYDGHLSDIHAFHINREHAYQALNSAKTGPVPEGCVGGGTGMNCHEFKSGIGTSSRIIETSCGSYTVAALVQANYGLRRLFRVDGIPVGKAINIDKVPTHKLAIRAGDDRSVHRPGGSIIVILATDAPLIPIQLKRLAGRATVGLARLGCIGHDGSGDIFLAFSTGNQIRASKVQPVPVNMFPANEINHIFEAAAESTEEAVLNALCMAEDMVGKGGVKAHAIPLDELTRVMKAALGQRPTTL